MSNVVDSVDNFAFDNLTLGNTQGMQGGGYFSRLLLEEDSFIIQSPKCNTKKVFVKQGKKCIVI